MTDILLNDTDDLLVVNGDLVIGDSTLQNQVLILKSVWGDFKQSPSTGAGLERWLKADGSVGNMLGEIKSEFEKDGMTVLSVTIDNTGKLTTDAHY
jgi:hypothetical protein